jgi:ComF family protein
MAPLSSTIALAVDLFASVVGPPRCAACDARVPRLAVFCAACASTVERAPEGHSRPLSPFVYGGAIARAIARLKYERRPDLARPLGDLLWGAVEPHAGALRGALVVPVPLHPTRLAERGFNQSALLARPVARRLAARFLPLALARVRDTPRQTSLDRDGRFVNVVGAFRVRRPERIDGRPVLLIDDVCTSGATTDASARALSSAGASSVTCAVLACAQIDASRSPGLP